ncbi:MAG TPA: beta-galactosidase [Terriglobia bacterium]|nr:beta-galactosidase [Terriglobia bacterium]
MSKVRVRKPLLTTLGIIALILSGVLSPGTGQLCGAPPPANLEITSQLRIGTEFFLNRTETKETVFHHFRIMHDNGLTLVRIFVIWDDIERTPDHWDFTGYDWIYDAAAENGIKIVATLCAEDPPGWVAKTPFYHNRINLNDPENRKHAAAYIEKVVNRYRNHPAQGVWLLANEPTKYDTEPATFRAFGDWLQAKYGTVEELNRHYFRPLASFSDIVVTPEELSEYWTDYHAVIDWREFNIDNLVNQLLWIKGQIRALDPNHPTHINVTEPTGGAYGQDVWKEKQVVDILGASIHPAWIFRDAADESEFGERFAYRLDVIGSPAGEQPWWVTELQSGPTIFTGQFPLEPPPADMTRWLWDAFGAGARGVIFWLWHPRVGGSEAGEWGLVSLEGKPTDRLEAVHAVVEGLHRNSFLTDAKPQPMQVGLLYNRESAIMNSLDDRTQKRGNEVEESLVGCYMALHRAHIPVRLVDLDQLKKGLPEGLQVLYIPYSYAMDDQSVAALRDFVGKGGTVWADGLTAWKNDTGEIRPTIPGGLSEVFGAEASDIYPVRADHPYSVTEQNEAAGELWKLPLELKGAEVVRRDREGKPFALRNHFRQGQVYYFESALTLAYFKRNNPTIQQWIVEPALRAQANAPVQMKHGSDKVGFRGLVYPSGLVSILTNWGTASTMTVAFRGDYSVADVLSGRGVQVSHQQGLTLATVELPAGAVSILRASKPAM